MKRKGIENNNFGDIVSLINQSRLKAYQAVNRELIELYWKIGKYISKKTNEEGWGKSTVQNLADYINDKEPGIKGFSDKNLWRMKQFYEVYKDYPKLSALLREINWTNNVMILSKCETIEEKEFYLQLVVNEQYTKRELERQINSCCYERTLLGQKYHEKLSPLVREFPEKISKIFKEQYIFDFLNLSEDIQENDLQKSLVKNMKKFVLELGKDFIFVGENYRLQVGMKDFYIDLLFFHRNLNCLVAFELKTVDFMPEHLGQLNFYLEALDRDVRKKHENPSIGVLLCKGKDDDVVEYAMSRQLSPTLISEYEMALPDKKILREKLREICAGKIN